MIKITSINKKFFNKKNLLILITTVALGTGIVVGTLGITSNNKEWYDGENRLEPMTEVDKYVYENEISIDIVGTGFTFKPSNIYKYRIFKENSDMSHYRIELQNNNLSNSEILEHSDWKEIPEDGLITINRKDFSDIQYGSEFYIRFGTYDSKLGTVVPDDTFRYASHIAAAMGIDTLEDVKKWDNVRKNAIEEVKKIVEENDTEFDKVKKTYDYVMKQCQYSHGEFTKREDYIGTDGINYTDCTGYADIINAILNSLGIESFSVYDGTNFHSWNIVKVDGNYYHLDATFSDTGSWYNTSKYRYFLVSDEFMRNENRWFVTEKDVKCDKMYDLTGIVSEYNVRFRGH